MLFDWFVDRKKILEINKVNIKFFKLSELLVISFITALPVHAQTCNDNVLASTSDSSFTINDDGTATHIATGLMWKICSEGQTWSNGSCLSTPEYINDWSDALGRVVIQNTTGYAGYADWRLPNVKELLSIVEFKCQNPAINESIFVATPAEDYWTSTHDSDGGLGGQALGVDFNLGTTMTGIRDNNRFLNSFHVRLVRNAQ